MVKEIHFLHFPRTGGSWTRRVLKDIVRAGQLDLPVIDYGHDPPAEKVSPSFTIARHVDTWLESWYKLFRVSGSPGDRLPFYADLIALDYSSFPAFLDSYCVRTPGTVTELMNHFRDRVDFVLRQEHLSGDLIDLLTAWQVPFGADQVEFKPKHNVSPPLVVEWPIGLRYEVLKLG